MLGQDQAQRGSGEGRGLGDEVRSQEANCHLLEVANSIVPQTLPTPQCVFLVALLSVLHAEAPGEMF